MDHRRRAQTASTKPVIIGTGLVALDVVISDSVTTDPILCAGGTCGNVLTALAFLGWQSYPIARLRSDAASKRVVEDLKSWGVKLDFVSLTDSGSTPVVVQHIRQNRAGERSHSFSRKCPACGAWLPWYKAIKAATVPDLSARLPKADVFYFDRTSRGAVSLAQNARKNGALVVFEPSSESDPALLGDALAAAHIVKVASDRLSGNEALVNARTPLLLIETLGSRGLRFTIKPAAGRRNWRTLPAFRVDAIRDSAGAGDWCTAGIISSLGLLGPEKLAEASPDDFLAALKRGQAMASWTCRYDGARGGMYASSRKAFDQAIGDILKGRTRSAEKPAIPSVHTSAERVWCDCCLTGA
jgi:sugar/nucleoside kinase (ribokinase family)